MESLKHKELTDVVICAFYTVYNALGFGFLEKVYENALVNELGKRDVAVSAQSPITVRYDGMVVGEYYADIVADDSLIIEVKAVKNLLPDFLSMRHSCSTI